MGIDALQMRDWDSLPSNNQPFDLDIDDMPRCELQPQDSGSLIKAIAPAPLSFRKWLVETLIEEEAARTIQLFMRYHLKLRSPSVVSMEPTASTTSSIESLPTPKELDEDHLQYEILLWYGSSLGSVGFTSCDITGYPCVEVAEGNDALPGMWSLREGDFLITINDHNTSRSVVPFDAVMQILDSGVRPAPEKGKSYPVVMAMTKSGVVGREGKCNKVSAGDQLLTINHFDVFRMGFKKTCQVMQFAPKPLVLTFRRASPDLMEPRSLDL
ncbi:hypothetical protein BBJ29_003145 [Phytophthora kernoviae]|uniref:PDZ domain-containing protein n=1 Tax=Phytophthora kernoviae TaxID=325452 RepID=A0A3F2RNA9_9STRA|nr:hypothetical protein BBJ29_003145 [Phytophthora kernoviae]RLN61037.1 hypothetical protein BBP00_00005646 [Phytophthora kernoviae]